MKKFLSLLLSCLLCAACLALCVSAGEYDAPASLLPDPDGEMTVSGCDVVVNSNGSVTITLNTTDKATVTMVYKDGTTVYDEPYSEIANYPYIAFWYDAPATVTTVEAHAHYARKDKGDAGADLFISGMKDAPSYFEEGYNEANYGVWNIYNYLKNGKGEEYVTGDYEVLKFYDIEYSFYGAVGDEITFYAFTTMDEIPDGFGTDAPEDPSEAPSEEESSTEEPSKEESSKEESSKEEPTVNTVKETITVDGKIDDLGWTSSNAKWTTLSKWFVDEGFDVKGETVKYAVRSDADNVYIAIEIGHNWSDIAADSDLSTTAGVDAAVTTGTRVRLWIGGGADGAPAGFFDIVRQNGEVKTLYRKVAATDISAAINGKVLEICLPKTGHEQFTIGEKAKLNVNFSDIIYGEEGNKYAQINAFEEDQGSNWKSDANYPEFVMADIALGEVEATEKPTDPTSDSGIIALAVIASLAAAGAVIVKKSR